MTATAADIDARADATTAEVDAYLRARLPAAWVDAIDRDDADALARARAEFALDGWWEPLADAGYATPSWPVEYGGLDAPTPVARAVARTLVRYKVPRFTNVIGIDLVGPAILRWGTDEQKARFLRPIARHEEIWCQLFSEPGAGSDLAGLSTRAVRDGDRWVVTGQKVWTSLGDTAAYGLLLARTDPDVPKHRGITAFLMPMRQDGVTVRPLRQMTGDAEFSEVFFDEAAVDDSLRLGEPGDGWRVAVSVLLSERQAVSGSGAALPGTVTGRSVAALVRRHSPVADPVLRQRLVSAYMEDRIAQLTNQRAAARRRAGQPAGPEASITKLFFSEHSKRLQNLVVDLEGPAAVAWTEGDRWLASNSWAFLRAQSKTIAGGTSEIQRDILAERVLGLPKEPAVDRDVPWSEVRRS
jgi:alkylation response protein AidB-like acyl-CoA dehydrogenase